MQLVPGGGAGVRQLAEQPLLDFGHLVQCPRCQFREGTVVLGDLFAHRCECVDPERTDPRGEACGQRTLSRRHHLVLAHQALGLLVVAVGGGGGVDVRAGDVGMRVGGVERDDDGVGSGAVGGRHRPWLDAADVVFVEQRLQAGHVGAAPIHRIQERPCIEGLVHIADVPAG